MPPDPERWLTVKEVADLLHISVKTVLTLLHKGTLVGINVHNSDGPARVWRIMHPGEQFIRHIHETDRHLEHVPLLTCHEVGVILGIAHQTVERHLMEGN